MRILNLIDEDVVNYKKTSMFISTCFCDWKCCKEGGFPVTDCQNNQISSQKPIDIDDDKIINRYVDNPLTNAIVFGGLEPMLQFDELFTFIEKLRKKTNDDVVIYTGYYEREIIDKIWKLQKFENIIVKFGRYVPNQNPHIDYVLGVKLANDEQYAEEIS